VTDGFLARLDGSTAGALLALGRERTHPARTALFYEGDEAHDVLIVRDGHVKVAITATDGREVVLDVVGPGDILGELSAVDGGARSATATTVTPATVTAIALDRFNEFRDQHAAVAVELLRAVTDRLRDASRRQVEFGTVDALGRVCRRVVDMIDKYGSGQGQLTIDAPLSQQEIGAWAGLSREAVVKALASMRALGWIDTRSRSITVLDPDAIRARANATLA
jgi:CRP-like cAMP-binding protein